MNLDDLISLEKSATPAPWEYDGMHPVSIMALRTAIEALEATT